MKKFVVVIVLAQLLMSGVALARDRVDTIDLEVVVLLSLNDEQAVAYSAVMQQQRALFQSQQPLGWQQQMAFYQETYARLKPVLTEEQHIRFVAYMDSFIEATPDDDLLAME